MFSVSIFRSFVSAAVWVALASGCQIRMEACVHRAVVDAVTAINGSALFAAYDAHNRTRRANRTGSGASNDRLKGEGRFPIV
jgi:hypothetical protein